MDKEKAICRSLYLNHFKNIQDENARLKETYESSLEQTRRDNCRYMAVNGYICARCFGILPKNNKERCDYVSCTRMVHDFCGTYLEEDIIGDIVFCSSKHKEKWMRMNQKNE